MCVHFLCGDYLYVLKLTRWGIFPRKMPMVETHVKKFHVFCEVRIHYCVHNSLPLVVILPLEYITYTPILFPIRFISILSSHICIERLRWSSG